MRRKRGETFVELLIAVTILAIIAVPLLHPFVTANKTNMAAKRIQLSNELAENLVETLKSEQVANVARNFNGYDRDKNGDYINTHVAQGSFSYGGNTYSYGEYILTEEGYQRVTDALSSIVGTTDAVGNICSKFSGQINDNYNFVMPNVEINGLKTDIMISYTPDYSTNINKIYSMNRSDCAYFAEDSHSLSNAVEHYVTANQEHYSAGLTTTLLNKNSITDLVTKTVTIKVEKDNFAGNTTVTVKYSYDIGDGYTSYDDRYYVDESVIFDNYSTGKELSAVYLYYFPLYGISSSGRDIFIVENLSNMNIDTFLVCMNSASTTALNTANYKASLTITEKVNAGVGSLCTKVHSNVPNAKWVKTSSNVLANSLGWSVDDLGNSKRATLAFKVTVTVYRHADVAFTTFGGNSYFTPDDNRKLCSFSGTLLDSSVKEV